MMYIIATSTARYVLNFSSFQYNILIQDELGAPLGNLHKL